MGGSGGSSSGRDTARFLQEVAFALDYDEDENDLTPEEYADFVGAKSDAERNDVTPRLITAALRYVQQVAPDWICERRSVYDRWCRVLAHHGALERVVPGTIYAGAKPPTITIDGVRYYRP